MPAFTRRQFIHTAALMAGSGLMIRTGAAAEVPWLAEVTRRPDTLPADAPRVPTVLVKPDGAPIRTLNEWKIERERLRKAWLEFLGPMPATRPPVKLEVLEEDKPDGCTRQLVRYESEAGLPVEGYLLRPNPDVSGKAADGKRAAVVALHPTSKDTIFEIAGKTGTARQQTGLRLAREGFVVFCPRCFLWQDAETLPMAVDNFKKRHPQTLGMHKMLWDAMRGVDILAAMKYDVDPNRIGAFGHSLGSKETFYLAAFDDRVAAGVASEGGIGFNSTNWDASWYLGTGIKDPAFKLNHHQLLALIAPRPFLILGGETGPGAADGDRTWPYIEAALPAYRLYGEPARLALYNHHEGHTVSDKSFERIVQWLKAYL